MEYVSAYTVGASSSNRRTVRRHTTNVCVILDILASSALRVSILIFNETYNLVPYAYLFLYDRFF